MSPAGSGRLDRGDEIRLHAIGEQHLVAVLQADDVLEAELLVVRDELERVLAAEAQHRRFDVRVRVDEVHLLAHVGEVRRVVLVVNVPATRVQELRQRLERYIPRPEIAHLPRRCRRVTAGRRAAATATTCSRAPGCSPPDRHTCSWTSRARVCASRLSTRRAIARASSGETARRPGTPRRRPCGR